MRSGAIASLLVVAIIASAGVGYFIGVTSTPSTSTRSSSEETQSTTPSLFPVYEENCSIAYFSSSEPNGGSICAVPISPVIMPMTITLSSVSGGRGTQATGTSAEGTLQDVFFGVYLESGQAIRVSMNSTSPIILRVYLDNRTGYDTKALANEVEYYGYLLTNQTGVATYEERFLAQQSGLYIYELTVNQPNPVPHASFDVQRAEAPNRTSSTNLTSSSCTGYPPGGNCLATYSYTFTISVNYTGQWKLTYQGNHVSGNDTGSGFFSKAVTLSDLNTNWLTLCATAQKLDGSNDTLILTVTGHNETSLPYGVTSYCGGVVP